MIDDGDDDRQRQRDDDDEPEVLVLDEDRPEPVGHAGHDRGEDDHRHAVADAPLADQLAHPHQHGGAGDERGDDQVAPRPQALRQDRHAGRVDRQVAGAAPSAEHEHESGRLQRRQGDRDVPGVLGDLALPDGALLLQLLELGDHHAEDLHDDARRDVGHDPEGEDREALEGAAGEQVEEADGALGAGGVLQLLDRLMVDPGNADRRPEPVDGDHHQREQDLVAQIRDLEDVLQAGKQRRGSLCSVRSIAGPVGAAIGTYRFVN